MYALLDIAKIQLSSDTFRQLCLKYGNMDVYGDSSIQARPKWLSDLLEGDFKLPEDPHFKSIPSTMTYAQFLELSEHYLPATNSQSDFIERKLARRFDEPFEL